MSVYFGCQVPPELLFDVERDVWIREESDGTFTLGMTDVAQTRAGKLIYVRFKRPGRVVKQGQAAATIESAKWVGPFPMPFTAEIVETNEEGFNKDILLLNKDPYERGWLCRVRPINYEGENSHLVTGDAAIEAYKKRIDELGVNCIRCADDPGTILTFNT